MSPHGKPALTDSERMSAKAVIYLCLQALQHWHAAFRLIVNFIIGFICSLAIPLSYIDFPIRWFKGEGRQITALY